MEFLPTLYNSDDYFSDISIQLQNNKTISCHKSILSVQSEVFKKMFSIKEMKESSEKIIKIEEDSNSIEMMLNACITKMKN